MKKKIFSVLLTLVLVLSFSLVTALPAAAQTDRLVPSEYNTIQEAIDAAEPGDTIIVSDDTYQESISITTADLTLRSENGRDSTIIENVGNVVSPEAAQCGFLIRGSANNFKLGGAVNQGFTFSGGTSPRLIQLNNSPSGVEISYNTVNTTGDASTGILIGAAGATGLTVDNNIFIADEDATYQDWPLIGPDTTNPVLDVTVTGNEFTGSGTPNKYGAAICLGKIGVSSLAESTIAGNTISAFDRGIIISADSADLDVSGNTISDCDKGVQFRTGTHAEMENNTFANNTYNIYHAAEIVTGGSSFYGDIQDAIDVASSGETILVYAGTYTEDVTVDVVGITIQGESLEAIVDGGFALMVDDITIDGLTIENGRPGPLAAYHPAAISAEGESDGHTIINNTLIGNGSVPSNGILLCHSNDDVLIDGNVVYNWRRGITLRTSCDNVTISNNEVYNNLVEGIGLGESTNCVVTNNDIHGNNTVVDTQGGGGISVYKGSGHLINRNDIYDNLHSGLSSFHYDATIVDATCNWWGHASGPGPEGLGDSVICDGGEIASYEPWLLEAGGSCYEQTQFLPTGWTLVSTDNAIDTTATSWGGVTIAYKYAPTTAYVEATVADLVPVDALYAKTDAGGAIGLVYSGGVPVASSKDLEAGWNLISSAIETNARAVLSPLRYVQVGEQQGVGLATLVSQGSYNRTSDSFYLATLIDSDWDTLGGTTLKPFDGYWVYMNAAKTFGVVPN